MTNATKVLLYLYRNTLKGKTDYALVELSGQEPLDSLSLDDISNAIKELSSEGIICIAKNIASTFSLTSCDPSTIAASIVRLQHQQPYEISEFLI